MPTFAVMPARDVSAPTVWVLAETEAEARRLVSLNVDTHSAAQDRSVFICVEDTTYEPPPGVIIGEDGRTRTVIRP